jgi:LysM repeat protein
LPTKNLTLGLALAFACAALAHGDEHHNHKASIQSHAYVIRNGDFDWAIAHKHGISVAKLHRANPDVNWNALPVGTHVRIPGDSSSTHSESIVAHHVSHSAIRGYAIKGGDNDWILAHRAGITVRELKSMNPSVNWDRIHPGQHIELPGSAVASISTHRIHTRYAKITSGAVRIHRQEGLHTDVITTVDSGIRARVLDRDGSWYLLRFPKGTEGWVKSEFLASAEAPKNSARRSRHHRGESYVSRRHRRRNHGNSGEYLAANEVPSNEIVHKALTYKNVPYVWGGTSRSGADCSGYTKMVFHTQGINLPRTSREQSEVGQRVAKGHLQAGDLVFFHTGRGQRVTHAAIYIGKGKFIHASSGGGHVQVNSLNSGYYANHFATARRVAHSKKQDAR